MGTVASQITSLTIVYTAVYSDADQSKHQSSASLAFVWGIHRGPVNSPHKWPVSRKMFPFDDVIIVCSQLKSSQCLNVTVWIELQYVLGHNLPHSDTRIRHHGAAFLTPCEGNSPMACVFLTPWWRHQMETFPPYWPFVWGIDRSLVNSYHKGSDAELWCFLRCAPEQRIEYTNRGASDLSHHGTHYNVTVIPRLWKMVPCLDVVRDLFTRTDVDWLVLRYLACLFTIECVLQEPQLAMGKNFLFYLFIYFC